MAKLTLYHAVPSRSMVTRWMLEEVGEPYDVHLVNLAKGENRAADHLAINPMGKVPALRHGDVVITENAANFIALMDGRGALVAEYAIPTPNAGARAILVLPDGRAFFSEHDAGQIGEAIPVD